MTMQKQVSKKVTEFLGNILRVAFSISTLVLLVDIAGIGLIAYGVYLIYPPAAFIVSGGLLWFEANIDVFKKTRTEGS